MMADKLWRCSMCMVIQGRRSGAPTFCPVCKAKTEFQEVILEARLTVG